MRILKLELRELSYKLIAGAKIKKKYFYHGYIKNNWGYYIGIIEYETV